MQLQSVRAGRASDVFPPGALLLLHLLSSGVGLGLVAGEGSPAGVDSRCALPGLESNSL